MRISNRLEVHAVAASVVALGAAAASNAAVVTWNINQSVGATVDGLYINVETGVTYDGSAADANFPGWDLNPYGGSAMQFFWSGTANGPSAGVRLNTTAGGTTNGSLLSSLPVGFVIGNSLVGGASGASFGSGSANFTSTSQGRWTLNALNYFGFRFTTAAGDTRYGYGVMQMGATQTVRTLVSVHFEDTGGAITVVPAPGAIALLGLAGIAGRRRR